MNKEFQKLKGVLNTVEGENREEILKNMRENLLKRNNNAPLYTLGYTHQGITIDINTCEERELLEIDGDMVVFGK